jgi:hypothetical protein
MDTKDSGVPLSSGCSEPEQSEYRHRSMSSQGRLADIQSPISSTHPWEDVQMPSPSSSANPWQDMHVSMDEIAGECCQQIISRSTSEAALFEARVLSKPAFWIIAYSDLHTLDNKAWIDIMVADFYLATIWYATQGNMAIHYVSYLAIQSLRFSDRNPTYEEIARFMHDYHIPLNQDCEQVPVTFLIHHHNHFFGVIFDYTLRTAYVLGRKVSEEQYNPD